MNKLTIIFLAVFFLQASGTKAQIALDTTVDTHGYIVGTLFKTGQISETETKYLFADTTVHVFVYFCGMV